MLISILPTSQSHRYFPSHIATIERLAAYYIESQVYEKAITYLEKAVQVQLSVDSVLFTPCFHLDFKAAPPC